TQKKISKQQNGNHAHTVIIFLTHKNFFKEIHKQGNQEEDETTKNHEKIHRARIRQLRVLLFRLPKEKRFCGHAISLNKKCHQQRHFITGTENAQRMYGLAIWTVPPSRQ